MPWDGLHPAHWRSHLVLFSPIPQCPARSLTVSDNRGGHLQMPAQSAHAAQQTGFKMV